MTPTLTADITGAHAEVVSLIQTIPDAALDWLPDGQGWSLKQAISHLAHANDFYVMIVGEARASNFGDVRLSRESAGVQRMLATDAAVARCTTTQTALDCFERTYQNLLSVLHTLTPEELDRPFAFADLHPDAAPVTTTLLQRVIQVAADHLREHLPQLSETLARWRSAHTVSA